MQAQASPWPRTLIVTAAATTILKLLIAAWIPLTGDEAYFVLWGQHPAFGYYDHPPMTGWILWLMLRIGHAEWILRLPAVLFSQAVGLGLYLLLRRRDTGMAALAATLYLISPINVLNVLMTTDTALLLFVFLAVAAFVHAQERHSPGRYVLAGLMLGLAFLSKYFAAMTGLGFVVYTVAFGRSRRAWVGLLLVVLAALPFAALHLWWNYNHAWATVIFNLFSRAGSFDNSLVNLPTLAGCAVYLVTPPVFYYLVRRITGWRGVLATPEQRVLTLSVVVPMVLFFMVALRKSVGLHWLLSFIPFVFALAPALLSEREIIRSIRINTAFTALHLVVIALVLTLPLETFRRISPYPSVVMGMVPAPILEAISTRGADCVVATTSYSQSAVLGYQARRPVLVFGHGSLHGRQYDLATDFRRLDGTNMLIVGSALNLDRITPYFGHTDVSTVSVRGAAFDFVRGTDFRYARYREEVLLPVIRDYYTPPPWLPCRRNPMRERYENETSREP